MRSVIRRAVQLEVIAYEFEGHTGGLAVPYTMVPADAVKVVGVAIYHRFDAGCGPVPGHAPIAQFAAATLESDQAATPRIVESRTFIFMIVVSFMIQASFTMKKPRREPGLNAEASSAGLSIQWRWT